MKFLFLIPMLGILSWSGVVSSETHKDSATPRQAPVFSGGTPYDTQGDSSGHSGQIVVYDTLNSKRPNALPSESYTNSQQQGKSNFGLSYAAADSSSGYSSSYPSPSSPSPSSYVPLGNRPGLAGYGESRPTVVQPQQSKPEETYAYYYQHYPTNPQQYGTPSQSYGASSSFGGLFDSDLFGGLSGGDLGGVGAALGGIGGLGALGLAGLATLAKGVLALKPLLIFGLLLLLLLPLLILFLPIPIITIPQGREGRASQLASAVSSLTQKVLGSEECLERILCKIPPVPRKFQGHAKGLWVEYGPKVIHNPRLAKGLDAYFQSTDTEVKQRAFKCNQQFKCSNKFF